VPQVRPQDFLAVVRFDVLFDVVDFEVLDFDAGADVFAVVDFRAGVFFALLVLEADEDVPDFLAALFAAVDFEAVDLAAVDFFAVDFEAVDFDALVLEALDFDPAAFDGVDFFDVDLAAVDLEVVDLVGLDFFAADVEAVDLAALDFEAVVLEPVVVAALDFAAPPFLAALTAVPAADPASAAACRAGPVALFATSLALGSLGSFLAPDTTALSSAPAVNLGTAVFFALILSPVRGLRTQRASRTRFSNDPKPVIATFSPRATSRVMVSRTDSSACCACLRLPSKRVDRVSIS
jgi:hypothetical protein